MSVTPMLCEAKIERLRFDGEGRTTEAKITVTTPSGKSRERIVHGHEAIEKAWELARNTTHMQFPGKLFG